MALNRSAGEARLVEPRRGDVSEEGAPSDWPENLNSSAESKSRSQGQTGQWGRGRKWGEGGKDRAGSLSLRGSGGGPALGCGGSECPWLLRVVKGYLFSAFRDVSISPQGRASDHLVLLSLSVLHPKKIPNPI